MKRITISRKSKKQHVEEKPSLEDDKSESISTSEISSDESVAESEPPKQVTKQFKNLAFVINLVNDAKVLFTGIKSNTVLDTPCMYVLLAFSEVFLNQSSQK